jgi:uncharacterized membrane protein YebE (DUF533 family)
MATQTATQTVDVVDLFELSSDNIRLLARVVSALTDGLIDDKEVDALLQEGVTKETMMAAARDWANRLPR